MILTRQDRLTIGKARARLHDATRALDLALERGCNDDWEPPFRIAMAAVQAFEASRTCRLLASAIDLRYTTESEKE